MSDAVFTVPNHRERVLRWCAAALLVSALGIPLTAGMLVSFGRARALSMYREMDLKGAVNQEIVGQCSGFLGATDWSAVPLRMAAPFSLLVRAAYAVSVLHVVLAVILLRCSWTPGVRSRELGKPPEAGEP